MNADTKKKHYQPYGHLIFYSWFCQILPHMKSFGALAFKLLVVKKSNHGSWLAHFTFDCVKFLREI